MISACMTLDQLRKSLSELEEAHRRGFTNSLAIVHLTDAGFTIEDHRMAHAGLILRVTPPDGSTEAEFNFGRFLSASSVYFRDGQVHRGDPDDHDSVPHDHDSK